MSEGVAVWESESHPRTSTDVSYPQDVVDALGIGVREVESLLRIHCVRTAGHWLWRGSVNPKSGHGCMHFLGRQWPAHRFVWMVVEGVLLKTDVVHHVCPLKRCVFPAHMRIFASNSEHLRHHAELRSKGRPSVRHPVSLSPKTRTHCPQGHPYEGDNLYVYVDLRGYSHRICRACKKDHIANFRARQAAKGAR